MENVKLDAPVNTNYKSIIPIDLSMWVHIFGDGNIKVGDSHLIATLTTIESAFNNLRYREGYGSLAKATHIITYNTDLPTGAIVHIDFKAWNSLGNVNATIIDGSRTETGFYVKVDADCEYTYVAKIINL